MVSLVVCPTVAWSQGVGSGVGQTHDRLSVLEDGNSIWLNVGSLEADQFLTAMPRDMHVFISG